MKAGKKREKNNFTKLTHIGGISLIVLVITIIVIVILASAVILTISNNNPVAEANRARYESDRANMQAILTNTVAKVMAKNQGVVNIKTSQINTITSGVKETTGEVNYTVENATNVENSRGKIVFGKGTNTETIYYTGREIPIYAAGETKWYVDEEGIISLEVAGIIYGSGEKPLDPGLYDENDVMIASWDELVNDYGIDVESDYATEEDVYNYMQNGTMPDTIQSGNYPAMLFQMNTELANGTKLVVGDVEKIGAAAFLGNTSLKEIELSNSISSIGIATYAMCSNLNEINIPNNVTSIEMLTFGQCTSLKSIEIPDSVTSIGDSAFEGCSGLTSVTIGNLVESIGVDAFWYCSSLISVIIPDSVISIGNSAFEGCSSLISVIIPNSVTSLERSTFMSCSRLTSIDIPNSVTSIGDYAFRNSGLTSVIIPDSVTSIGEGAFDECHSLINVVIPDSVESIGDYAFDLCSNLTSIKIPDSITYIGKGVFSECSSLTSVVIPDSVTSIEYNAFWLCTNLTTIYYKGTATGAPWGATNATVVTEF